MVVSWGFFSAIPTFITCPVNTNQAKVKKRVHHVVSDYFSWSCILI